MFEDSLFESSGSLAKRDPRTTVLSFTLQLALAGALLMVPLIYTDALPGQHLMSVLHAPVMLSAATTQAPQEPRSSRHVSELDNGVLRAPPAIPRATAMIRDEEPLSPGDGGIPGAIPGNRESGIPGGLPVVLPATNALPELAVPQKVRVSSGVAQGMLVHQVKPAYPALAMQARIQGTVVLQAVIGKDGAVQNLRVMSGPPLLIQSAMEAVRQWRYKPYSLNGEPVEVDTQVNVNFVLGN